MTTPLSTYRHFGKDVTTVTEFVGRNQEICICRQGCKFFKPGEDDNCEITAMSYQLSKIAGIVLVMTCVKFVQEESVQSDNNWYWGTRC